MSGPSWRCDDRGELEKLGARPAVGAGWAIWHAWQGMARKGMLPKPHVGAGGYRYTYWSQKKTAFTHLTRVATEWVIGHDMCIRRRG